MNHNSHVQQSLQVKHESLPQVEEFKYPSLVDRKFRAASAEMWTSYRSVVVRRVLELEADLDKWIRDVINTIAGLSVCLSVCPVPPPNLHHEGEMEMLKRRQEKKRNIHSKT